jgi:hypothetical protein
VVRAGILCRRGLQQQAEPTEELAHSLPQNGTIRWRAETDKTGHEQIVPMEETLLRSYQQPDAETVKRVVLHPTQRIVSG